MIAFEYLEIRPCTSGNGKVLSYKSEEQFSEVVRLERYELKPTPGFSAFWRIVGHYTDRDGASSYLRIGDYDSKESALVIVNALLAPMAKARDLAREPEFPIKPGVQISPAEMAACALDDFINQSSNHERL